jgi:Mrp family chromosome partitioning ATPase
MLGGRGKLPVLAEISGGAPEGARAWSLRREDMEALARLPRALGERRLALVSGDQALTGSIALAGAAGASGRRSVLLECDLARPRLAADLGLAAAPGLHEYLRWEATAPQILQPLVLAGPAAAGTEQPLVCIVAGRRAADPATLIGLESFRHALAKLRRAYDLVVIAAPALESQCRSVDALAIHADTLLLALSPALASRRSLRRLRATVRRLPIEAGGAIVVGSSQRS